MFEEHQPLKRAVLTNKTRNPVLVENLPVEFILTTDARLRSRFPHEQYLYWFREPYATIVLVTCEVLWKQRWCSVFLCYIWLFFRIYSFIISSLVYVLLSLSLQDLDEFKNILKPRLKLIVQNDDKEWFIVFVSKAHPSNDLATKSAKKVYAKLEVDFSSKKRERLGMLIGFFVFFFVL